MPRKIPETNLRERGDGYELSNFEHRMIFEKEDRGYLRWMNRQMGMYYLDPSPFENTPYNEIYVSPLNNLPPRDKFIKVTVREEEEFKDVDPYTGEVQKFKIKYVMGWEIRNPNEIRGIGWEEAELYDIKGNRLLILEEFLNAASLPISDKNIPFDDLKVCLGSYLVASPKFTEMQQGGINTAVLGTLDKHNIWLNFKRITSIIPKEFRYAISKYYYKSIRNEQMPITKNCEEVSVAFLNREDMPVHIPLPFEYLHFKPFFSYKDDFYERMPMARGYLLDTLLFTPDIPDTLQKKVEDVLIDIRDEVQATEDTPCFIDIGAAASKLTTSYARLRFNLVAEPDDLNDSKDLFLDAMTESKKQMKMSGRKKKNFNKKDTTPIAKQLEEELKIWNDAGIPLTMEYVQKNTKLHEVDLENALSQLSRKGTIYYPRNNIIKFVPK